MDLDLFDDNTRNVIICGSDEAGRGPLAGPVVASSVILPSSFPFEILNDSKKMSEKERLEAEIIIKERAIAYSVVALSNKVIDEINILNASLLAMKKSSENVYKEYPFSILLVDGNKTPDVSYPVKAIVKGDSKIPEIMAASILSKTHRDRIMMEYDKKWPMYNFKKNKGYPTKDHYEALRIYGPTPIHRFTFRGVEEEKELKFL